MAIDFSPYAAVLLDLDGTLYHEDHALPGAAALVKRLQAEGIPIACLSNSTSSPMRIMARLEHMGIDVDPDAIYTAAGAAADYVVQHFGLASNGQPARPPRVYNLSTEGVQDMLEGSVQWVTGGDEPCDAVIAGTLTGVFATEERLRVGLRLLRSGAKLIGICADRVYPSPRGIEFGAGALSWMLAYAAGIEPFFTGKPEPIFFEELCRRLRVAPDACLLIGDNIESDLYGAKSVGMRTILSLTGVTRRADLAHLPAPLQPDLIVEDLTEL